MRVEKNVNTITFAGNCLRYLAVWFGLAKVLNSYRTDNSVEDFSFFTLVWYIYSLLKYTVASLSLLLQDNPPFFLVNERVTWATCGRFSP